MARFNGLGMNLGNLSRLSDAVTRSISAENPTGTKGDGGKATEGFGANAARDLGEGWKVAPAVWVQPGETFTLTFSVHDEGDAIYSSTVLLDNLKFHQDAAVGMTDPLN